MTVNIKISCNGEDAPRRGAFPSGGVLEFALEIPRALGIGVPKMHICPDGGADRELEPAFVSTDGVKDTYKIKIDPAELIGTDGLLYYCFLLPQGERMLYTHSVNNVDCTLSDCDDARFRLLVYEQGFDTPAWFRGGTMYQIFPDRFFRGEGEVCYREDSEHNADWYGGVPQYGEYPGAPVKNNVFFGGNLWGVAQKLDRLVELGVSVIYLNPIFEAASNHKYDIGDYMKIDGGFGGEAAFAELIRAAKERGIRVILDGVFNHTGDDSLFFDRYGRYGSGERYRDRYCRNAAGEVECWWGIEIMPRLNHKNEECRRYFTGDDGVARKYIREGIAGWRLDVADELCDEFLDEFRAAVKDESKGEALIIGEVWENAADKVAYGQRRRYLRGRQLDSVMNYPLKNGLINFAKYGDAEGLYNVLTELYSSYPRAVCDSLMNIIGTHDTERILTVLGGDEDQGFSNDELAQKKMTSAQREKAKKLLEMISALQYTVYGVPSLYYGDEAGVEGYHDPFCRLPYPWGREDAELLEHYIRLGKIRASHEAFAGGDFDFLAHNGSFIAYERKKGNDRVVVASSCGGTQILKLKGRWRDELTDAEFESEISVLPETTVILSEVK